MSAQTTLDEVWLMDESENKDFFGGLIQLAVSMYHLTNGNPQGAKKIYEKAIGMIQKYGDEHMGVALGQIKQSLHVLFNEDLKPEYTDLDFLKRVPKLELRPGK